MFFFLMASLLAGCAQPEQPGKGVARKIKVDTARVVLTTGGQELSYSGTVEASQTIPLNFRTSGTVEQVLVESGDMVRKGQVLATLDDSDLKNLHVTALAGFSQATDAYDRLKSVYEQGSLPEIKWVEMKTNLEKARATLGLATENLEKTKLVAPIDAMVGRRNIEPGQSSISLVQPPIELVRLEKVLVKIAVPENEINRISKGGKATVAVLALDGMVYSGAISNISPVAEMMSRTYTVKITIDNPRFEIKPGMVCDVTVATAKKQPALVVPYQAVMQDNDGRHYVFVVNPDNASVKKQQVSIRKYLGNGIVVTDGLSEGQTVVTGGNNQLSDNSLIEM